LLDINCKLYPPSATVLLVTGLLKVTSVRRCYTCSHSVGKFLVTIDLDKFSELAHLCWDVRCKSISRREAFARYINNWGHVHQERLSDNEKSFINELTIEFGRGYFFPRVHGRSDTTQEFLNHAIAEHEIDSSIIESFLNTVSPDPSYPGMRNGIQYYWRADVEHFLKKESDKQIKR